MRRTTVVVALLVVVGVGLAASGFFAGAGDEAPPPIVDEPAPSAVEEESLITVDGDYRLWPYTSRDTSVEGRTLAINVLVHADAETTRHAIERRTGTDWEETEEAEAAATADADQVLALVERDWADAHSSDRYSYMEEPDRGVWLGETFELHDGAYLGVRDHLRAYESPDGTYTAVQAHEEYYDWFRLRHTVPGIDDPAVRLEDEFIYGAVDAEVSREYRGMEGGWSDGWVSVIEPASVAMLGGALLRRRTRAAAVELARRTQREAVRHADAAVLGTALAALIVGVRVAGVALEAAYPGVGPKLIAGPLYLVIAVGIPALVVAQAPDSDPSAAFLGVVVGLGAGFVIDFAALGVAVPPDLLVHRVALLAALGVVAIGRAAADRPVLAAGLVSWAIGLTLPLADVI
ncbi:hypothetical protein [Halorubrum lacusprofundi]|jgi:hypothetical protein|uniref:Uncharacterized protein n=1 Tax=Halorubrum lacusprofundi (strain ATCC 49239 / DSM 5036 / JCM 8891 / ACAM 34) TaxID=416348 RepID=B9LQY8_HALLT|nr:hypothetical protein [Halorubrum lacusprofundi]ACM55740.1 conserved hypothetical protein [Halorubrum lacusprofundi ATCC 49239]MCG1007209.1 DUF4386 domain-containing protein [Halorubrum lacusprofundi]